MKKMKSTKKPNPYARKITLTFKVNAQEMNHILFQAHSYAGANVSEWLRAAALKFRPKKEDFEK